MTSAVDDIIRAAKDGSAGAAQLYETLAGAEVFFAVTGVEEQSGTPWILRYGDTDHGVFCTSTQHADLLTDVPGFARMSGRDLGTAWPDGLRAVVNPGTPLAVEFDSDAMHAIGATRARAARGTRYAVGVPADAPEDGLVEALRSAVRNVGGVRAAYLFQFEPEGGPSRLVCGLALPPGADPSVTIPSIADAVVHAYPPARTLDFAPLDGALLDQVADHVAPLQ